MITAGDVTRAHDQEGYSLSQEEEYVFSKPRLLLSISIIILCLRCVYHVSTVHVIIGLTCVKAIYVNVNESGYH